MMWSDWLPKPTSICISYMCGAFTNKVSTCASFDSPTRVDRYRRAVSIVHDHQTRKWWVSYSRPKVSPVGPGPVGPNGREDLWNRASDTAPTRTWFGNRIHLFPTVCSYPTRDGVWGPRKTHPSMTWQQHNTVRPGYVPRETPEYTRTGRGLCILQWTCYSRGSVGPFSSVHWNTSPFVGRSGERRYSSILTDRAQFRHKPD